MAVKLPITSLSFLRPKEVSLVKKPANQKEFLIVKSDGGKEMKLTQEGIVEILKSAKSTSEGLNTLTQELEKLQSNSATETDKEGMEKVVAELQKTSEELTNVVKSLKPADDKEADKNEDADSKKEAEDVSKKFDEITKSLEGLSGKIEALKKPEEGEEEKDEKDDGKDEQQNTDEGKPNKEEFIADVTKAMDERAEKLVGLFKEAAGETFGDIVGRVENIEKFLRGETEQPSKDESGEYKRNYGQDDNESTIENADNPFASMLELMG